MIVLERRIAGLFRAALKRCFDSPARNADRTPIQIQLGEAGLVMHGSTPEITVIYQQPTPTGNEGYTFALAKLAEFESKTADPVEISLLKPNIAIARWTMRGRSREIEIPLLEPEADAKLPVPPKSFAPMPARLLVALDEAGNATAKNESTRFALGKVQLRGKAGTIAGTDTKQLLVSGGFTFPFTEDLLIPRCCAFGLPSFPLCEEVSIGKTDTHLFIRTGPWTFAFAIDAKGRYPDVSSIIPSPTSAVTRFKLNADDAQRFLDSLVRKIRTSSSEAAVTLDLLEAPCLRFEMEGRVTEVGLPDSEVSGKRVRMCLNLAQFLRALELRFQEFEIVDVSKPLVARAGDRVYLAMPFPAEQALASSPDVFKIATDRPTSTAIVPVAKPRVRVSSTTEMATPAFGFNILEEAEGLRDGLFKVASHASKILRFLRETCTQQKLADFARSSLLALGTQSPHGGR